jgi:hypothetical protein
MPAKPVVIRCSALTQYPDCARRSAARLFWQQIAAAGFRLRSTPHSIAAAVGLAVHKGAEVTLKEKASSGRLPPSTLGADCAAESVSAAIKKGVAFDNVTHNESEGQHQAVGMIRAYHRTIAPLIEPILVEERLEAEVAPGLMLSGQPDCVAREPGRIRDVKTSIRPRGTHAPQIGGYSLLARTYDLDIEQAAVDSIQRVAIGKPQPDPVSKPVGIRQAETAAANIIRTIERDLVTFRDGDPERRIMPGDPWAFMANPQSLLCSAKFCPAFGTDFCHEGGSDGERG